LVTTRDPEENPETAAWASALQEAKLDPKKVEAIHAAIETGEEARRRGGEGFSLERICT
jgi:hypothetical protein